MENQKPGKYAKRLSESEYRDYKALQQQSVQLDAREQLLDTRETRLNALESDLRVLKQELDTKEQELDSKAFKLNQRERAVQADELQDKSVDTTLRHPQRGREFDF